MSQNKNFIFTALRTFSALVKKILVSWDVVVPTGEQLPKFRCGVGPKGLYIRNLGHFMVCRVQCLQRDLVATLLAECFQHLFRAVLVNVMLSNCYKLLQSRHLKYLQTLLFRT